PRPAATPPQPRFTRRTPRGPRHGGLPRPQRYRARLQRREAMAGPGHPLRQTRFDLPSRSRAPRDRPVTRTPRLTSFQDLAQAEMRRCPETHSTRRLAMPKAVTLIRSNALSDAAEYAYAAT